MDIIIGGAYQGKLEYALDAFGLNREDVLDCGMEAPSSFDKPVIYRFEHYILRAIEENKPVDVSLLYPQLQDKIIIVTDIFCGVVPVDPVSRNWREETGRTLNYLCKKADRVIRVFCGIGTVIK